MAQQLIENPDIWFALSVLALPTGKHAKREPEEQKVLNSLRTQSIDLSIIQLSHEYSPNGGVETTKMLNEICRKGVRLEDYDAFAFICGIISELLLNWVLQISHAYQTIGTFVFYWFMRRRQQKEGKVTEAKRVE
ncbi:hypothetical protein BJX65DRAFT_309144 [Aspergillus insuetus]